MISLSSMKKQPLQEIAEETEEQIDEARLGLSHRDWGLPAMVNEHGNIWQRYRWHIEMVVLPRKMVIFHSYVAM